MISMVEILTEQKRAWVTHDGENTPFFTHDKKEKTVKIAGNLYGQENQCQNNFICGLC